MDDQSAELRYLELRIKQLEQMVTTILTTRPPAPDENKRKPLRVDEFIYPDVQSFVEDKIVSEISRPVGGDWRWCAKWWAHGEAVSRFEALWRAWENLQWDEAFGSGVWQRDWLDNLLPQIVGPRGPFARCSPDQHEPPRPLRVLSAPKLSVEAEAERKVPGKSDAED